MLYGIILYLFFWNTNTRLTRFVVHISSYAGDSFLMREESGRREQNCLGERYSTRFSINARFVGLFHSAKAYQKSTTAHWYTLNDVIVKRRKSAERPYTLTHACTRINWEIFTLCTSINYRIFEKVLKTIVGAHIFVCVYIQRVKTEKLCSPMFPAYVKQLAVCWGARPR